ncbi:MAG: hypothetical protein FD126_2639, partial [Elusimicrobia bacterium]
MTAAIEKLIIDPLAGYILRQSAAGGSHEGALIRVGVAGRTTAFEALEKPKVETPRATLEGAAEKLARAVLGAIEGLMKDGTSPEALDFDAMLNAARADGVGPRPDLARKAGEETPAAPRVFNPDTPLALGPEAKTTRAAHNNPAKRDDDLRYAAMQTLAILEDDDWSAKALGALRDDGQAEGWLRIFIRQAKEKARDANVTEPIELVTEVDGARARFVIHRGHEMGPLEKNVMAAHFTGEPPASLDAAQARADQLAAGSTMVWNYILLDLYRRVATIPGARMGFATGEQARGGRGTDYWIELPRERPQDLEVPVVDDPRLASLTPHQKGERKKLQGLMLGLVGQETLDAGERDGASIRIAAATAFSLLAVPEDVVTAR